MANKFEYDNNDIFIIKRELSILYKKTFYYRDQVSTYTVSNIAASWRFLDPCPCGSSFCFRLLAFVSDYLSHHKGDKLYPYADLKKESCSARYVCIAKDWHMWTKPGIGPRFDKGGVTLLQKSVLVWVSNIHMYKNLKKKILKNNNPTCRPRVTRVDWTWPG